MWRWAGIALVCCAAGCGPQGELVWVAPALETAPVPSRGDAADDPAIWIHPTSPERSLVVGTDKRSGLLAFDLDGNRRQYIPAGNLNNVDLRAGAWGRDDLTIAAASARRPDQIVLFELDHASGELRAVGRHDPVVDEPYGICLFLDAERQPWIVLNGKDGLFVQFELHPDYRVTEARRWRTNTQPEGCVADDAAGMLYIGEEGYGVWTLTADPAQPAELAAFAAIADGAMTADVEGLALYRARDADGGAARQYLLVSSQGDNSFAVYDTGTGAHMGGFRVGGHDEIDDVSETDGIAATSTPLPGFPDGLLVVQDGDNPRGNQNFKLVSFSEVRRALGL